MGERKELGVSKNDLGSSLRTLVDIKSGEYIVS